MSTDPPSSFSGAPIYTHGRPQTDAETAATSARFLEPIRAHIEAHLGPIDFVFREAETPQAQIDVLHVPPTPERNVHTLVTCGMSNHAMAAPVEDGALPHAELLITLPPSWPVAPEDLDEPAVFWPIRMLKGLARVPRAYETWLWHGHTVGNGEPSEPYDASTPLSAALILAAPSVPADFQVLKAPSGEEIVFFSVIPIYLDELDLKMSDGLQTLMERFAANGVTDVIAPLRQSVAG